MVDIFREDPRLCFLYHVVNNGINGIFPANSVDLYSSTYNYSTYWFAYSKNSLTIDCAFVFSVGPFVEKDFDKAINKFLRRTPFIVNHEKGTILGDKRLTDQIIKQLSNVDGKKYSFDECPCVQYHMDDRQMKLALETETPAVPEGYQLDSCTPADTEYIRSPFQDAELEQYREKLRIFPSSCVRFNGDPVANFMVDPSGEIRHQFVQPEHRRKGLGNIVEIDLMKKMINAGHAPVYTIVSSSNEHVVDAAERSPLWTRTTEKDGSPFTIAVVDLDPIIKR